MIVISNYDEPIPNLKIKINIIFYKFLKKMEFKKPKPKKNSFIKEGLTFPVKSKKEIIGIFDGQTVTINDMDSMNYLYEAGNFGKGTLSKGKPSYHIKKDDVPKLMLQHQFENQLKYTPNVDTKICCSQKYLEPVRNDFELSLRDVHNLLLSSFTGDEEGSWKSWKENQNIKSKKVDKKVNHSAEMNLLEFKTGDAECRDEIFISLVNEILELRQIRKPNIPNLKAEVIVLNTSFNPNTTDLSLTNVHAQLDNLSFGAEETLKLHLEESFFLKSILGSLNIVDFNFSEISISDLWEKFNASNKGFTERYMTYHYYRAKGWVVKSGLKFGGDYLLYKDGPAYYHASYLVKVLDKKKKITWREFLAMNRLVETFNKDLILTNILPPLTSGNEMFPDVLTSHAVQEVIVKRWFPSKDRCSKEDKSCS